MTIKKLENIDLSDFKLVIATASQGNVGQFVADLIINSLQMEKFAIVFNEAIIPLLGGTSVYEHNSKETSTACEIYVSEKEKLALLLCRTPITANFQEVFCQEVIQFIKSEKIRQVIQVSSAYSQEQHFMDRNPFEYLANQQYEVDENLQFNKSTNEKVSGSGTAVKLHELLTVNDIPSIILYKFSSEGININDSVQFYGKLSEYLLKEKVEMKFPISWKNLFGFGVNSEIY